MVCWEAVLSSLEDRRPGLAVLRLVGGPGGQYTCNKRNISQGVDTGETLTLLAGADIHLPRSPSPRSSISSRPSEIRDHLEKENKLDREIHKGPLPDVRLILFKALFEKRVWVWVVIGLFRTVVTRR